MPTENLPACTYCGAALPESGYNSIFQCPGCRAEIELATFPALTRASETGQTPQLVLTEGEAACFYHPEKRAVAPCDACGRFLCALCDVGIEGGHYCPGCLEKAASKERAAPLELKRVRYDLMLWYLVVLPIPFCMILAPVTATAALVVVIWKWRAPPSLVINTRIRMLILAMVAVLELIGAGLFWTFVATQS